MSLSSHHRWLSTSTAAHDQTIAQGAFPSLILGADQRVTPMGSFAEAQAAFLDPDPEAVRELAALLMRSNAGIVAHYYMDVELQGVLQAVAKDHLAGRVGIADSLRMGDMAVEMVHHFHSHVTHPQTVSNPHASGQVVFGHGLQHALQFHVHVVVGHNSGIRTHQ